MGCAGSKPEEKTYLARPSISGAADAPAQAQASEAQKDAAAEDIQNAAASFLARKKKEQEKLAAASDAALAAPAPATEKPSLALDPVSSIVDGLAQLSHRLFGGGDDATAKPAEPSLNTVAEEETAPTAAPATSAPSSAPATAPAPAPAQ